jgi:hypothetical protein
MRFVWYREQSCQVSEVTSHKCVLATTTKRHYPSPSHHIAAHSTKKHCGLQVHRQIAAQLARQKNEALMTKP